MDQVVVAWALADHPEVVHEGVLLTHFAIEIILRDASRLVLGACNITNACQPLRLKVGLGVESPIRVQGRRNQDVQIALEDNIFARAPGGARDVDYEATEV